jgi:hypothetical protein|uniref:Uncharacterized protein n=1 Tax=Mus musculus TaxID=10090 RepID=Q3V432_MOUSE|nr:unnamed protein product [Mus musculus]
MCMIYAALCSVLAGAMATVSKVKEFQGPPLPTHPLVSKAAISSACVRSSEKYKLVHLFCLGMKSPNPKKIIVKCISLRQSRARDLTEGRNLDSSRKAGTSLILRTPNTRSDSGLGKGCAHWPVLPSVSHPAVSLI